jgi:hypothetical protein
VTILELIPVIAGVGAITYFIMYRKYAPAPRILNERSLWLVEGGFTGGVRNADDDERTVHWGDVQSILAGKYQDAGVDKIQLTLSSANNEYRISNDDSLWGTFVSAMERNIEVAKDWFTQVSRASLEDDMITVFQRPPSIEQD